MIEYSEENSLKINKVAEKIVGTCRSLDEVLQEVFGDDELTMTDLGADLLEELDELVLECEGCNWWVEAAEVNDDGLCGDCS